MADAGTSLSLRLWVGLEPHWMVACREVEYSLKTAVTIYKLFLTFLASLKL